MQFREADFIVQKMFDSSKNYIDRKCLKAGEFKESLFFQIGLFECQFLLTLMLLIARKVMCTLAGRPIKSVFHHSRAFHG